MFYNTIKLSESQWEIENAKAKGLQTIIENIFNSNKGQDISGWQMKHFLDSTFGISHDIISVRRSITNLKNEGKLFKTAKMRIGASGKQEHLYCLNSPENASKQLPHEPIDKILTNIEKIKNKDIIEFFFEP